MHEQAWFFGTFPSLAGKVRADLLFNVSWEDVRGKHLRIPEVELRIFCRLVARVSTTFTFLFGSEFEFLLVPPSELAGVRFAS